MASDSSTQQPGQTVTPNSGSQNSEKEPATNWKFEKPVAPQPAGKTPAAPANSDGITWSASEFIAHSKSIGWYLVLALAMLVLAGLVYLLTRDKISTAAVIVAAFFFGFYANRRPRTLTYTLNEDGLKIGEKYYALGQFKSFSTIQEGAFSGFLLLPLRRFMPSLEVFYDPKDEEKITSLLLNQLPFEDKKLDPLDSLMKRIRF